ncbi:MAG: hypothetical protein L0H23_13615, partial [Luteimonas sp.]|nr:hypothetical protein [Luteimonas sp.]
MKQHDVAPQEDTLERPLARIAARELSAEEIAAVAGGRPDTTHATGPRGDDPADPGVLYLASRAV